MMTYQGDIDCLQYGDQAKLFHGEVVNTRDEITFQGTSAAELEQAFHESVDDYVSSCEEEPNVPKSIFAQHPSDNRSSLSDHGPNENGNEECLAWIRLLRFQKAYSHNSVSPPYTTA